MSGGSKINWTKLIVEGLAITASILVAFAIDAWWDGLQDRELEDQALGTLLEEIEVLQVLMDSAMAEHAAISGAGEYLLTAIADPDGRDPDSVAVAAHRIESMFLWGTDVRAYELLVSSGRLDVLSDPTIADGLVYLRNLFEIVNRFQAREEDFLESQLAPYYDDLLDRGRAQWRRPPALEAVRIRRFPADYLTLLESRKFNNLVQRRLALMALVDGFYPRVRETLEELRIAASESPAR